MMNVELVGLFEMKIKKEHRDKLNYFLKEFYKRFPNERFTIFHFVKYFKQRLKKNKDAWTGVSGDTASGKSYFVIMAQILFGRPYDLTKNITYIPKGNEIIEKFNALNFNTLLIDEAAKQMLKVQWQDKQQQNVNVAAMTERFKNNWVFLNMPNFNEFTKSMRRGNLMFRAIIPYRTDLYARVIIQRKQRNWRSADPWYDDLANDLYEKVIKKHKEIDNDTILKIERQLPNTVMDFIVPNLALALPVIVNEYERLKIESRKTEDVSDVKGVGNLYKDKYMILMEKVSKILFNNELDLGRTRVTKVEMAKALGVDVSTFDRYLKKENQTKLISVKKAHQQ